MMSEHVRVAWKPKEAARDELIRAVDEWSRRWAYTPWREVWACLTMRFTLRQLVRELRLRDGDA